jgi:hypothetical protein
MSASIHRLHIESYKTHVGLRAEHEADVRTPAVAAPYGVLAGPSQGAGSR